MVLATTWGQQVERMTAGQLATAALERQRLMNEANAGTKTYVGSLYGVTQPAMPTTTAKKVDPNDPFGGLEGTDRDAYSALVNTLKAWGLESLAPVVMGYLKNGYSADTISILLPETGEYKKRFSANDTRKKAGLPALSPAEYLSVESSYRSIMSAAGMPVGFYDSYDDFTKWIESDVSPTEIQSRVQIATELVNNADSSTVDYFKQFYSKGDLIAYALDRKRAAPLIEAQYKAAQVGGAAVKQGVSVNQGLIEDIAKTGVTADQARAGFGLIASEQPNASKLASIYDETPLTTEDLISETFLSDTKAAEKRKRLASQERATFNGSSQVKSSSLARETAGKL